MSNKQQKEIFYETLFKTYYRQLFYYVFRYVNDAELAADITNDVFCYLWEKYDQLDLEVSPLPWMHTLARNYCVDHLRHKEIVQRSKANIQMNELYADSFKEVMEHERRINQIIRNIELLPPQTRNVFNECFMKERKYKEVAEELGISVNTVKTMIMRALQFLREKENE